MKINQNIPLRVKINKTPKLLKPQLDKETKSLLSKENEKHYIINNNNNFKPSYPKISTISNSSNIIASHKNIQEDQKQEDIFLNNNILISNTTSTKSVKAINYSNNDKEENINYDMDSAIKQHVFIIKSIIKTF